MSDKLIPLTQGKFAIVDADDFDSLSAFRWYAAKGHYGFYAVRNSSIGEGGAKRSIRMHRFILGAPVGAQVDHANRNPLDNRKSNLRLATPVENSRNRGSRRGSSSQYLGVCWDKESGKWMANIQIDRRLTKIGRFADEIAAARAYDAAARQHFGVFANPNFGDSK